MARNKNRVKETAVADDVKKDEQLNETPVETKEPVGEQNPADGQSDEGTGEKANDEGGEEPESDNSGDKIDTSNQSDAADNQSVSDEPLITVTTTVLSDIAAPAPIVEPVKSDRVEAALGYIAEYVNNMDPNKFQDHKSGVRHQARLYRILSDVIRLPFIEFKEAMDRILSLIHQHRDGVFADKYSRRFFEQLYPTLSPPQTQEFDNLLSILVTVGSTSNRSKAMQQIDLTFALKAVPDPKAQQNLAAYFSAMR